MHEFSFSMFIVLLVATISLGIILISQGVMKRKIKGLVIATSICGGLFLLTFIIWGTTSPTIPNDNDTVINTNAVDTNTSNATPATPSSNDSGVNTIAQTQRQVTGKATDLGAGTFTGGKDIPSGLYDATPVDGSGNLIITDADPYLDTNEILGSDGQGVVKVRTKISDGDKIQLENINKTHFEPVTAPFVTSSQTVNIYSGSWTVGEDIFMGRYIVSTTSGSGNFIVYDSNGSAKTNEILGDGGVKQVTVDLNDGDIVTVASLNQVTLTPTK